jgi:hypothetical protein
MTVVSATHPAPSNAGPKKLELENAFGLINGETWNFGAADHDEGSLVCGEYGGFQTFPNTLCACPAVDPGNRELPFRPDGI